MLLTRNNGVSFLAAGDTPSAAEVMNPQPLSISDQATLSDAAAFLTTKRISAAPVIDQAGRPVGAISLSDIARHACAPDEPAPLNQGMTVRDVMTPGLLFVRPGTPIEVVINDLLEYGIHRLFVVDESDVVVGVISTLDVLRHLRSKRRHVLHPHADF